METDNGNSYKVVILGQEHHNALNVARQLWLAGVKPYGIINDSKRLFSSVIIHSRYWKKCVIVRDEKHGIKKAIELYGDLVNKPVLITCTDKYAACVDNNLNELKKYFVCPGVDEQGMLTKMMDKQWQHAFCKKNDINVVPSLEVNLLNYNKTIIDNLLRQENVEKSYIVKPLVSALGDKSDIRICENDDELHSALCDFKEKNYDKVIVQHVLEYDYEMLLVGACFNNCPRNKFILLKTIRSYPVGRGTGCYRRFVVEKQVNEQADSIMSKLRKTGYRGLVDIEFFYKDGRLYLNEFNLRSSGSSFVGNKQLFLYAYDYVRDAIGEKIEVAHPYEIPNLVSYTMTEYSDVRFPLYHGYSWKRWLKELRNVDDYSYYHWEDPLPMFLFYLKVFLYILFKRQW